MLRSLSVLIVEDEILIAMNLADSVEELGGTVVGPVATVAEALLVLETQPVTAAILDANLQDRDVTPVALHLASLEIPVLLHTGTGSPPELAAQRPDLPVIMKPAPAEAVVKRLIQLVAESD